MEFSLGSFDRTSTSYQTIKRTLSLTCDFSVHFRLERVNRHPVSMMGYSSTEYKPNFFPFNINLLKVHPRFIEMVAVWSWNARRMFFFSNRCSTEMPYFVQWRMRCANRRGFRTNKYDHNCNEVWTNEYFDQSELKLQKSAELVVTLQEWRSTNLLHCWLYGRIDRNKREIDRERERGGWSNECLLILTTMFVDYCNS